MHIRAITIEDIPTLLAISQDEDGFKIRGEGFWTEQQLKRWIEKGDDVLLAAEREGRVVGFVLTALHSPTGKVTWENQLVVHEYRRQGVAHLLTEEMLKRLKENGATYVNFLVKSTNQSALSYYRGQGFEQGDDCAWFGKFL
ncbi:MAG TPA: N-acetyltransferase [Candidatus Paceibacterota bacterium]|nr:N-acetyltransferase [Candidatus Paceibacterota bacterium]